MSRRSAPKIEKGESIIMKEYRNPYDLIADSTHAAVLDLLTDDERDYLRSALDYESIVLRYGGVFCPNVEIVDSITRGILNSEPFCAFVRESVLFALEACAK